jgi:hypothetical protein
MFLDTEFPIKLADRTKRRLQIPFEGVMGRSKPDMILGRIQWKRTIEIIHDDGGKALVIF